MHIIKQLEDKKEPLWDEDRKKEEDKSNKKKKYYLNDYYRNQLNKN